MIVLVDGLFEIWVPNGDHSVFRNWKFNIGFPELAPGKLVIWEGRFGPLT